MGEFPTGASARVLSLLFLSPGYFPPALACIAAHESECERASMRTTLAPVVGTGLQLLEPAACKLVRLLQLTRRVSQLPHPTPPHPIAPPPHSTPTPHPLQHHLTHHTPTHPHQRTHPHVFLPLQKTEEGEGVRGALMPMGSGNGGLRQLRSSSGASAAASTTSLRLACLSAAFSLRVTPNVVFSIQQRHFQSLRERETGGVSGLGEGGPGCPGHLCRQVSRGWTDVKDLRGRKGGGGGGGDLGMH